MPSEGAELDKLRVAVENLAAEVARIQQRVAALEQMSTVRPPQAISKSVPLPSTQEKPASIESRVGLTVVNRVGAITLAIGIVFFFKYAADNRWIGARARVVLGVIAGLILIAVADRIRKRGQSAFSQGVCGCGLAILFISLYASFAYYELVPQFIAFIAMIAACALAIPLSFRYGSSAIASLGLVGGLLTPPLLTNGRNHPWLLFSYLLFLNFAALSLAWRRQWKVLLALAFSGTALLFLFSSAGAHGETFGVSLLFLCVFFASFFAISIRFLRLKEDIISAFVLPVNALWSIVSAWNFFTPHHAAWLALFALVLAIVHMAVAFRFQHIRRIFNNIYVIGHGCLLIAALRELNTWAISYTAPVNRFSFLSAGVSILLAIYAVVMIASGVARRLPVDRVIGLVLIGIVVGKLYLYDVWRLLWFYRISAFVILGVLLLAASYLYSRFKDKLERIWTIDDRTANG